MRDQAAHVYSPMRPSSPRNTRLVGDSPMRERNVMPFEQMTGDGPARGREPGQRCAADGESTTRCSGEAYPLACRVLPESQTAGQTPRCRRVPAHRARVYGLSCCHPGANCSAAGNRSARFTRIMGAAVLGEEGRGAWRSWAHRMGWAARAGRVGVKRQLHSGLNGQQEGTARRGGA